MINQKHSFSIKAHSREKAKYLENIVLATGGFRFEAANEHPDLLIYELGNNHREDFRLLESRPASGNSGELIITSDKQDTDILRQAMRIGAKEFLGQPFSEDEIKTALEAFKERKAQSAAPTHSRIGKVIHLLGAKGGVGTTTLAVNLSIILSEMKPSCSVALVDLNTVFGEIPLFLSVKPVYHWGHIAKNMSRLDSTFLLNTMAKHASGVHILPSPSYLNGHPPATAGIMEHLLDAMKKTFDVIIVDGGQSLDDPALKSMTMSDQVLVVTLLSLPCLHNTNNVLKSLENSGMIHKDRIRLIINRYLKKSDITIKEAAESVQNEIFWNIPNDYNTTMSAINRGVPLHNISPKAAITKSLAALADELVQGGRSAPAKKKWRLFKR